MKYDNKMKTVIQTWNKRIKTTKEKTNRLQVDVTKFEEELKDWRIQHANQNSFFSRGQSPLNLNLIKISTDFKNQIEALKNEVNESYNIGLKFYCSQSQEQSS